MNLFLVNFSLEKQLKESHSSQRKEAGRTRMICCQISLIEPCVIVFGYLFNNKNTNSYITHWYLLLAGTVLPVIK